MKLYLSSYRIGTAADELVRLYEGRRKTIAYIPNALDYSTDEARRALSMQNDITALEDLGFDVRILDLREYFGGERNLKEKLSEYSGLFVRGGNCFILRRAFRQSGLDSLLPNLLHDDSLIYAGYSAGIDMLAPSLHGAELVDDSNVVPDGYDSNVIWDGIGILPYTVAPHYKSDHAESNDIDKSIQYMVNHHIPFIALRDGEVIVIDGDSHCIATI